MIGDPAIYPAIGDWCIDDSGLDNFAIEPMFHSPDRPIRMAQCRNPQSPDKSPDRQSSIVNGRARQASAAKA
jgi:hypothetical protein